MAENKEALVLQMSADIRRMEKGLNAATSLTNRKLKEIESRFDKMNANVRRSSDEMSRDVRASIAAIGVAAAVSSLGRYADAWTTLRNQVRQYSDVVGPVEDSTRRLNQIATDAGVSVQALGTTFAASARAAKTLGSSGADVFAFNEAVAKGSAIANTGVAAVEGALVQLGQAIGSPKVQLGEFNSVIEGTPRLAQAFADGVEGANGSVAKLRSLIASGEISGGELFQGLVSQLPKLRSEFSQTEATLAQSITRLQNAAVEYVGTLDKSYGVSASLAGLINEVASNLDLLANAAVAAGVVIGTQGLAGAFGAVVQLLKDSKDAFSGEVAAIRERANTLKKLGQEQAKIAVALREEAVLAQASRNVSVEQIAASQNLTIAYKLQEEAVREVANAKGELALANRLAGSAENRFLTQADDVTAATRRLQEAETRLAILRKSAPAEVRAYYLANQELAAAQSAANVAADKLTQTQKAQAVAQQAAAGAGATLSGVWRGFATILSGPAGTIALILALTAGMSLLGRSSDTAATRLGRAEEAIRKMNDALGAVTTAQGELESVNKRIEELVKAQGEAARDTADLEIAAINRRIAKNQELAGLYKDQALAELAAARAQQAREDRQQQGRMRTLATGAPVGPAFQALQAQIANANAINAAGGSESSGLTPADWDKLAASAVEEARAATRAGRVISDVQLELLNLATERSAVQARIQSLQAIVDGKSAPETAGGGASGGGGSGDAKSKLRQYQTALEDFNATIKEIAASEEGSQAKSAAAVQALLDYAKAADSVAAALAEIPGLSKVLLLEGEAVARNELGKIAQAGVEAVATGYAKIEADRTQAITALNTALRDAQAAGLSDTSFYFAALAEIEKDYADKRAKLFDELLPPGFVPSALDAIGADNSFADGVSGKTDQLRKQADAAEELKRIMRDSVKGALREGITTGDWDESFRSILADAVTTGLDSALNRVGDFLADFLFGKNGLLDGIIQGVGNWAGSNIFGQKAVAGSVPGGRTMLVGERGPELLQLGSSQTGKLLDASHTRRALSGRGGAGAIDASITFTGPIDATNLQHVHRMLEQQRRQIMAVMPAAVNGTLQYNRKQQRRI